MGLLGHKGILLAYGECGVHQHPQVIFCQIAVQMGDRQRIFVHGLVLPQVQDFTLPLVKLHEPPVDPFLQPVEVPLNGCMTFWLISHSFPFCVISTIAEGTISPVLLMINEDVKQEPVLTPGVLTGLQLDFVTLISTLWACPHSQFSIHHTVYLPSPCISSLSMRIL